LERTLKDLADATRVIALAEQLADRFDRIGLDESDKVVAADKRLLDRVRKAIEEYQR
jgi:hypothetical protein